MSPDDKRKARLLQDYRDVTAIFRHIKLEQLDDETLENLMGLAIGLELGGDEVLTPDQYKEVENSWSRIYNVSRLRRIRTSASHGFVYLLQSPTGAFKIGRTKNPSDRVKTFGVQLPFEIEYVCLIETSDMKELERFMHQLFKNNRINGEWFAMSQEDIDEFKSFSDGVEWPIEFDYGVYGSR